MKKITFAHIRSCDWERKVKKGDNEELSLMTPEALNTLDRMDLTPRPLQSIPVHGHNRTWRLSSWFC